MKDAIVDKLRTHLANDVDTECKVIYLLCEVRKLLDKAKPTPMPFTLRLYCHWAVHVDLTMPTTTGQFLGRIDDYISNKLDGRESKETLLAEHAIFGEFLYFETFRKELAQFLVSHALPTSICDEDARWVLFVAAYTGVIEDGSLSCESKDPDELRLVKKVTFTKGPTRTADANVPFDIRWDILLKDERRVEVEVGTQKNPNLMHWGLRLVNVSR